MHLKPSLNYRYAFKTLTKLEVRLESLQNYNSPRKRSQNYRNALIARRTIKALENAHKIIETPIKRLQNCRWAYKTLTTQLIRL